MEQHYTVLEVAEKLEVSRDTVDNAIRNGKLRAVKIGRLVRVPESAVAAYIEAASIPPPRAFTVPRKTRGGGRGKKQASVPGKFVPLTMDIFND